MSLFYTLWKVLSTDKKTCFSKIKEISVKKIFLKYSNFLKHVLIDLLCQNIKKNDFAFSSSSMYDFSMIFLVIFTNSCFMMHIYIACGIWELGATTG